MMAEMGSLLQTQEVGPCCTVLYCTVLYCTVLGGAGGEAHRGPAEPLLLAQHHALLPGGNE